MLLQKEREQVVEYGKRLSTDNLTTGTSGNISVYNREKGLIAIKPSGIGYFDIKPEDVVVIDIDGNIVDGNRSPSSEVALHTIFYKNKPEVNAVVHCHSVFASTFAALGMPIKAVHYVIGDVGANEIPCAPYVTFGTEALAESAIKACHHSNAAILGNHGQVTCGTSIESAYGLAVNVEFLAEVQYRAMSIGKPKYLTEEDMDEVLEKFKTYGQANK